MIRNVLWPALTGALAMTVGGCLSGNLSADAQRLNTEQIAAALSDATTFGYAVNWRNQATDDLFCMYHDPTGTVQGNALSDGALVEVAGTYTIADDQICYSIEGGGYAAGCRTVVEASSRGGNVTGAQFYDPDGALMTEAEVGSGNQLSRCVGNLQSSET